MMSRKPKIIVVISPSGTGTENFLPRVTGILQSMWPKLVYLDESVNGSPSRESCKNLVLETTQHGSDVIMMWPFENFVEEVDWVPNYLTIKEDFAEYDTRFVFLFAHPGFRLTADTVIGHREMVPIERYIIDNLISQGSSNTARYEKGHYSRCTQAALLLCDSFPEIIMATFQPTALPNEVAKALVQAITYQPVYISQAAQADSRII